MLKDVNEKVSEVLDLLLEHIHSTALSYDKRPDLLPPDIKCFNRHINLTGALLIYILSLVNGKAIGRMANRKGSNLPRGGIDDQNFDADRRGLTSIESTIVSCGTRSRE